MSDGEQLGLVTVEAPAEAPARPLPVPETLRFQPLRAGILNVWQYDDQELRFHQGRLILRGENGTGKSKALEVLLPFLLDADLSPRRLDPFQGDGRSMRWNLLEGGKYDSRVGYVWLELGRRRRAEEGDGWVFVTLGCGLRASRRTSGVEPWYFVTDRRIGGELSLLTSGRQPLAKEQLRRALAGDGAGDGGTVFQRAADYRQRVDELLYGLGSERFKALRHLLLQLRRPQLSEKLDPRKLSELLTHSLPPVDEDLVGRLSEVFERLAHEEKEIARLRQATAGVETFLGVYRDYCRGVARSRAAEVRVSDSRYHKKAKLLRDSDDEAREIDDELEGLERRLRELAAEIDRGRGELRALEQSEAMKSARALATLETHVRTLVDQAERDQRDAAALERETGERAADHAAARERDQRQRHRLGEPVRRASEEAAAVGLEAVHQGAEEKLAADAEAHEPAARGTIRAAVGDRGAAVEELRGLIGEVRRGEERFRRCDGRRREADEQVRAADERRRAAGAAVESELESLAAALDDWAGGCTELGLEDDELRRLHAAVDREDAAGETLPAVLGELADTRRDRLVAERTALEARREGLAGERRETVHERRRVETARELGPEPPSTRTAAREDRPGSPFYLLCDFADGVGAAARAGLEAALEAAGLLDAWVLPDGRLLDAETLDTVLIPSPLADRAVRTLADVLVVADTGEEPPVAAEVVEGLLASVVVGETAADVEVAVGVDGGWRLGPLHGRWTKPVAEYFGAAAREAARRRQLAELDALLASFDARLAELDDGIHGLAGRQRRLLAEVRAAPSATELENRRHQAAAASADLERRRAELSEAESALAAARRQRDDARRVLERRAGELRLAAWVDDLEGYLDRLHVYEVAFAELAQAHLAAQSAAASAERARTLLDVTRARREQARRRAAVSRGSARTVEAELATLQATAGAAAREIVERHGRAQRRLEEREADLESARGAENQAARRQAAVAERRRLLTEELAELGQVRETAAERLYRLAEVGLLVLVLEGVELDAVAAGEDGVEGEPDVDAETADAETADADTGNAWSMTRALAVARAIEKQTTDVDLSQEAANRRSRRMNQRFLELSGELGGELQPNLEPDGELQLFRVVHQQRGYDGPELLTLLRDELGEHERLLAEDERELLRSFLLGEVGDHLRGRLRQAHDLKDRINGLLEGCRTASGMTLRLSWRADEDADSRIRQVVRLLRRDPELLADDDRRELEEFFQQRIDAARRDHALVPWREHLLEALDYRRWHRFRILRRMPGESSWNELTQRRHAASSGGEKAVALHLPLFAAASAHYQSARPEAPRLILLDEAFAGIDPGMRGRCMGLLVDFDLDFMMTSYDEWGCYEELPGVATYQLYRDPSVGGVAAIRCVWNGERLIEDEAP
ncbi:MAG: TIGR02680 family protein [Thermoanaerobaculia bacterium]